MAIEAVFFDGETARDRVVTLRKVDNDLEFVGADTPLTRWSIKGLHPIDPPTPGQPFRITHDSRPGTRLVLRDQFFIDGLIAQNKHLRGGYGWRHIWHVLGWTVTGLAGAAAVGYVVLTILPGQVAGMLPDSWRNRAGDQVVKSLVGDAKRCQSRGGNEAVTAMVAALAEGKSDLPPVSVEIYDLPVLNAFATPGGRIILTRQLLSEAESPAEVTGVLAHEIGHVAYLHPESQLVRVAGLQILISTVTGGGGTDYTANVAGLAALLRYSREAELQADAYARDIMEAGSIDPTGLKKFFEKIMKLEKFMIPDSDDNSKKSLFDKIGNIFSTHPGTEDRIKNIVPLPVDKKPVVIMTEAQWMALKNICD